MTQKVYDPSDKHPPKHQRDMNPDAAVGINYGSVGPHPEKENPRTAYDVKEAHRLLSSFTDDQLKQIPILPADSRLGQDAAYIDLAVGLPKGVRGSPKGPGAFVFGAPQRGQGSPKGSDTMPEGSILM